VPSDTSSYDSTSWNARNARTQIQMHWSPPSPACMNRAVSKCV